MKRIAAILTGLFVLASTEAQSAVNERESDLTLFRANPTIIQLKTESVEYQHAGITLEGYLAYDAGKAGKRPAVLVVHQWKGLSAYEKKRAEMLVQMGYVVFCADIYGKGIRPENPKDAGVLAGKYKADRPLLRARVNVALDFLKKNPMTDTKHVAAIGYCFGGTTVLELARSGAELSGVVSFHGGLGTPTPDDAKNIKTKVLALHGADDPFVPAAEVAGFEDEMRKANVDWQLVKFSGAVHSFSDWNAGTDNSKGAAYNEKADKRSWADMQVFFAELFGK
ncbi:MAG TPA: dienelactone hydrolase family protein [Roseimicrobium sp.]|nr:dienelactone hydrolase family protein [Roseimicrobium sp.]